MQQKTPASSTSRRSKLFYQYVVRDEVPPTSSQRQERVIKFLKELTGNRVLASKHYFAPKLVEISDPRSPDVIEITSPPEMSELRGRIMNAKFTGKGDHEKVIEMLDDFDKLMRGDLTKEKADKRYGCIRRTRAKAAAVVIEPTVGRMLKREKTRTFARRQTLRDLEVPAESAMENAKVAP